MAAPLIPILKAVAPYVAQIASIARAHRLSVATRNVCDFEHCGVDLVNPFESQGR